MIKKLLLICIAGILFSCQFDISESRETAVAQWPEGVAYEIFVQSFYDSDNDSIGDIPGMTEKLEYLDDLGVDAVWLMPIMPSPSYHKYDVVDYYDIHPDYGTMDDFKEFLKKAHDRNIKVIIDLVINHTASSHPWFINASSGKDAKYRDYYVWADKDSVAQQIAKKETSFDSDNITQWHAVNGDETAEHYYGFFWGGMPDLNFDNPEVRKEVYEMGRYWLEEIGVDGFRLDAAKHIFPDDRAVDNHAFWKEFKAEMEKIDPDVYLVGEIWANAETTAPYAAGFTAFFNFDLAFSILESVKKGEVVTTSISGHGWDVNEGSFIEKLITNREVYHSINPDYQDAIFLTNHDQNRVMSVLEGDVNKAKVAAAILMTLPGTPYIYYGEEIGMMGKKPDERIREPFLWREGEDPGRPLWIKPEYNTADQIKSLAEQRKDENSLYHHYKELIAFRKNLPALTFGELVAVDLEDKNVLAYKRQFQDDKLLIIHNLSKEPATLTLPGDVATMEVLKSFNGNVEKSGANINVGAFSTGILSSR
jgi:alpha-amylase